MEFSHTLKNRFIKDFGLPIQLVKEPMFTYYVERLDEHFSLKKKLQLLEEAVTTLGGEDRFFAESHNIKDAIINAIQSTDAYKKLADDRLESYETKNSVEQQDIYNMGNVNRTFISVDLKHANFNVFKMYDASLVLNHNNYGELIGSLTQLEYFKSAKYLRQVIFGNMLPKKQQKLQKWVIDKCITALHTDVGIQMADFLSASSDEIVFAVDPKHIDEFVGMVKTKLTENVETAPFSDWIKVEAFTLKSVGDKKFFVKENCLTKEFEFKAVPSLYFMQVFKKYFGLELEPYDLMFYSDGYLAEFKETVFDNADE